jgi:DNA mismatch endonuclease (patch repair protein)
MTDVVDRATRSRMMSGIRGKDTAPELSVRRYLHAMGYRFTLHEKNLPGSPDLLLKKHRLVIFVHGCFWHRHPGCFYATSPATRREFWQNKLNRNAQRDEEQRLLLAGLGWRVLVVWECGIRHAADKMEEIAHFIGSDEDLRHWPTVPPRIRKKKPD